MMKNKYLILFLCFTIFCFSIFKPSIVLANDVYSDIEKNILNLNDLSKELSSDSLDDVEMFFLPALSIPISSAFGYLMGAFGVVAGSSIIYDNKDSITGFYNEQVEKFKLKCTALGIAGDIVSSWLSDLSNGIVRKSSDVYDAFKDFIAYLRDSSSSVDQPSSDDIYPDTSIYNPSENMELGVFYNLRPHLKGSSSGEYKTARIKFQESKNYSYDGKSPFIIAYNHPSGYYSISFVSTSIVKLFVNSSIYVVDSGSGTEGDLYLYFDIDGVRYYYKNDIFISKDYGSIPYYDKMNFLEALKEHLNSSKSEVEIGTVGVIDNVSSVDIVGPTIAGTSDVVINWDDFDWESILQGLGKGEVAWNDALVNGNVGIIENDIVIGGVKDDTIVKPGDDVIDKPGDSVGDKVEIVFPETDIGDLGDYKVSLRELFPFCLPFDLIDFINVLACEPKAPYFKYEMPLPGGKSYTFEIDLSPFDGAAKLLRNMEVISFIVGLIVITRSRMIRG